MKKLLILGVLIALFIVVSPVLAASISTDKEDYAPEEVVTIYGAEFTIGVPVTVTVTRPNGDSNVYIPYPQPAIPDESGSFIVFYQLDGITGLYTVDATNEEGMTAQKTFTDAVTIDTTLTLEDISTPLTAGQLNVDFSGQVVSADSAHPVPAGQTVKLQVDGSDILTVGTEAGGTFSGTFTAPSAGTYAFRALFPTSGQPIGGYKWGQSTSDAQTIVVNPVVTNSPPTVAVDSPTDVTVNEGETASQTGTYSDTNAGDDVSISASIGTVTKTGTNSGTWSWSYQTTDGPDESDTVTITANDGNVDGVTTVSFELTVNNVAPTATFGNDGPVEEGSPFTLSLTDPADESSVDTTAGFTYSFDCGSGYGAFSSAASASCPTQDNGIVPVGGKIKDKDGGVSEYTSDVTVDNVAPTATLGNDGPVDEGSAVTVSFTDVIDPGTLDTFMYSFDWDNDGTYDIVDQVGASAQNTWNDNGVFTVKAMIKDDDGGYNEYTTEVTVNNVAPTATLGNDGPVDEGSAVTVSFTDVIDPGTLDTFMYSFDWDNDGTYDIVDQVGASAQNTWNDNGVFTVKAMIKDDDGGYNEYTTEVTVNNVAPTVLITGPQPGTIIAVNTPSPFSGEFTDPGTADTHTAAWTFISNSGSTPVTVNCNGGVNQGAGTVNTDCTFNQAGIYSVKLTITDDDGGVGQATTIGTDPAYVVVYDPNGGFVTGGGWIMSPPGAYRADPLMTGKANFGFVSKYKKGATVPEGETEFQFKAGNLNFHSSTYQWLVVAGTKAIYKGDGTVNGAGNYGFLLSAIDGSKGETDKFRIKIWDKNNADTLVYDNLLDAADDANPTTILGGGSIVVHK